MLHYTLYPYTEDRKRHHYSNAILNANVYCNTDHHPIRKYVQSTAAKIQRVLLVAVFNKLQKMDCCKIRALFSSGIIGGKFKKGFFPEFFIILIKRYRV